MLKRTFWHFANTPIHLWTAEELQSCTNEDLTALAHLLGIPHSGTKERRIQRLLVTAEVRTELATWGDIGVSHEATALLVGQLKVRYSRAQLVELAKKVGVPHYFNKFALITTLLNWRNDCRRKGLVALDELRGAQARNRAKPQQLMLDTALRATRDPVRPVLVPRLPRSIPAGVQTDFWSI